MFVPDLIILRSVLCGVLSFVDMFAPDAVVPRYVLCGFPSYVNMFVPDAVVPRYVLCGVPSYFSTIVLDVIHIQHKMKFYFYIVSLVSHSFLLQNDPPKCPCRTQIFTRF